MSEALRIDWPRNDYSRVPFRLHHDEAIYALEMERIFRGPAWSYLCLEAEMPNPGDFRTTWIGDTPVVVVAPQGRQHPRFRQPLLAPRRDDRARAARQRRRHVCLYHRWCYHPRASSPACPSAKG